MTNDILRELMKKTPESSRLNAATIAWLGTGQRLGHLAPGRIYKDFFEQLEIFFNNYHSHKVEYINLNKLDEYLLKTFYSEKQAQKFNEPEHYKQVRDNWLKVKTSIVAKEFSLKEIEFLIDVEKELKEGEARQKSELFKQFGLA